MCVCWFYPMCALQVVAVAQLSCARVHAPRLRRTQPYLDMLLFRLPRTRGLETLYRIGCYNDVLIYFCTVAVCGAVLFADVVLAAKSSYQHVHVRSMRQSNAG